MLRPGDGAPRPVTLIPGDGIGPLVTGAVQQVMEAMHGSVFFERYDVHGDMSKVPDEVIDSIRKNKVCLKGGLATPLGGCVNSLNVQLRKELDLYASFVNCFNLPGLSTRHDNVDIVVIRENTEGEYSGLEHEVVPGVVESLKVITKFYSERIAKYAFEYAYLNNRKKVTPNLYGNLVANTAAGIAGGTGVMPGGNVGADHAEFEQGASAGNVGSGKIVEQKTANPVALLLSSAMLRHLLFPSFADWLETAVKKVISEGKYRTKDLGGDSPTQEVVDAVSDNMVGRRLARRGGKGSARPQTAYEYATFKLLNVLRNQIEGQITSMLHTTTDLINQPTAQDVCMLGQEPDETVIAIWKLGLAK
ncbi:Isocitrate dehydrogenase [NAD] regulatory subunit 1, mitochondrial-like protein [Drosera capensis]